MHPMKFIDVSCMTQYRVSTHGISRDYLESPSVHFNDAPMSYHFPNFNNVTLLYGLQEPLTAELVRVSGDYTKMYKLYRSIGLFKIFRNILFSIVAFHNVLLSRTEDRLLLLALQ